MRKRWFRVRTGSFHLGMYSSALAVGSQHSVTPCAAVGFPGFFPVTYAFPMGSSEPFHETIRFNIYLRQEVAYINLLSP